MNDVIFQNQPQMDNLYLIAIFKAMKEFIQEECNGTTFSSDLRLMEKIKCARDLFPEDRQILSQKRYC